MGHVRHCNDVSDHPLLLELRRLAQFRFILKGF